VPECSLNSLPWRRAAVHGGVNRGADRCFRVVSREHDAQAVTRASSNCRYARLHRLRVPVTSIRLVLAARRSTSKGKKPSSRYSGVQREPGGKFVARVHRGGKDYYLGQWPTERAAAIARDRAILYLDWTDRSLSFPRTSTKNGPASPQALVTEARRLSKQTDGYRSRFLGVRWNGLRGKWQALAPSRQRKDRSIGLFADELTAARARDRVVLYERGSKAVLNFPIARVSPASLDQMRRLARRLAKVLRNDGSRYRGVYAVFTKWCAEINVPSAQRSEGGLRKRRLYLGTWSTQKEAAEAFDRAVLYYRFATDLNFPKRAALLRPASDAELRAESYATFKKGTTSRFRGVYFYERRGKWQAGIVVNDRRHHLGYFYDEEQAAQAYDKAARRLHGAHAKLNFDPLTGEEGVGRRCAGTSTAVTARSRAS
jgi:hypothetical protein